MNYQAIEERSVDLLRDIFAHQRDLWPDREVRPINMRDPWAAVERIGYRLDYSDGLGHFGDRRHRFEVAGFIDRKNRRIVVSRRFSIESQRFTTLHEVGHKVLHPAVDWQHRERPVWGLNERDRDPMEQEADYFAACFLVPWKLLEKSFNRRYGGHPVQLDEAVAFELFGSDFQHLIRAGTGSLDFAIAVATTKRARGRHFEKSLAEEFGVSPMTMAIRLHELRLVVE
jgi:hypothetical protein